MENKSRPSTSPLLHHYKPTSACSSGACRHFSPQRTFHQRRDICVIYARLHISGKELLALSQGKTAPPGTEYCLLTWDTHDPVLTVISCTLGELTELIEKLGLLKNHTFWAQKESINFPRSWSHLWTRQREKKKRKRISEVS